MILVDHRNHHLPPLLYQVATAGSTHPTSPSHRVQFKMLRMSRSTSGTSSGESGKADRFRRRARDCVRLFDPRVRRPSRYFGHTDGGVRARLKRSSRRRDAATHACWLRLGRNELDADTQRAYLKLWWSEEVRPASNWPAPSPYQPHAMRGDFRRIDPPRRASSFSRPLRAYSGILGGSLRARAPRLAEIGVEVRTNAKVDAIDREGVTIGRNGLLRNRVLGRWRSGRTRRDDAANRKATASASR